MFIDKFLGFFVSKHKPFFATSFGPLVFMYSGAFLFKTIPMPVFLEYITYIHIYVIMIMVSYSFGKNRIHKKMELFSEHSEENLVEITNKERVRRNKIIERQGAVAREDDDEYKRLDEEVRKMEREMRSFAEGLNDDVFNIIKVLALYDKKNSGKIEETINKLKKQMEEHIQ